jgi:hypothetical protein
LSTTTRTGCPILMPTYRVGEVQLSHVLDLIHQILNNSF